MGLVSEQALNCGGQHTQADVRQESIVDPMPGEPDDEGDVPRELPHGSRSVSLQPGMEPIVFTRVLSEWEASTIST